MIIAIIAKIIGSLETIKVIGFLIRDFVNAVGKAIERVQSQREYESVRKTDQEIREAITKAQNGLKELNEKWGF